MGINIFVLETSVSTSEMDSHFKTRALEAGLLATSICPSPGFTPPAYEELEELKPKRHPNAPNKHPQTQQKLSIDHHKQSNLIELQSPQYTNLIPRLDLHLVSSTDNVYWT